MSNRQGWGLAMVVMVVFSTALTGCNDATSPVAHPSEAAPTRSPQIPLTVLAATSTANALEEIAETFQQEHGTRVQLSVGPSNALASQILAGAPADVYVSANVRWADAVRGEGLAEEMRPLLSNRLVLVVPRGNPAGIRTPQDLVDSRVKKVALAGENVPAGIYAAQALRSLDLYEPLVEQDKVARGHDVRMTLSYVERGEADAGIVYATDALISDKVDTTFAFPPSSYDRMVYPVVLLQQTSSPAARKFFEYLGSGQARSAFHRYGFTVIDESNDERRGR